MKFYVGREDVSDQETGLTPNDFRHVAWKEVGGWTEPAIFDGEHANRFVFDPEDEGQDILSAAEMRDGYCRCVPKTLTAPRISQP